MARFYGSMTGQARTSATRRGSSSSGMNAHVRGWNAGIRVEAMAREDRDFFEVSLTRGSSGDSTNLPTLGFWGFREDGSAEVYVRDDEQWRSLRDVLHDAREYRKLAQASRTVEHELLVNGNAELAQVLTNALGAE